MAHNDFFASCNPDNSLGLEEMELSDFYLSVFLHVKLNPEKLFEKRLFDRLISVNAGLLNY